MVSATVNVVRYSALVGGIAYGIFHRRTLQAQKNKHEEHTVHHHRQQLISDAKKAWQQQQQSKKGGVITNPDDPSFDLEKLLTSLESSS